MGKAHTNPPISFFPSLLYRYTKQFPAVAKVGAAHAGMGKMRVANHHDWEDFRSVIALTNKECVATPSSVLLRREDKEIQP